MCRVFWMSTFWFGLLRAVVPSPPFSCQQHLWQLGFFHIWCSICKKSQIRLNCTFKAMPANLSAGCAARQEIQNVFFNFQNIHHFNNFVWKATPHTYLANVSITCANDVPAIPMSSPLANEDMEMLLRHKLHALQMLCTVCAIWLLMVHLVQKGGVAVLAFA